MRKATGIRIAVVAGAVGALELACRLGVISRFAMIPPSEMTVALIQNLTSGSLNRDLSTTLTSVAIAAFAAIVSGLAIGVVVHGLPRARRVLGPFFATYYAVPIWVFYPLLIIMFGLNDAPKILIGYLYAVVAMIMATIDGLDHVPRILTKLSRTLRLGTGRAMITIVLPSAAPHIVAGLKLAIAYAFIGVIGSEFILSGRGLGYRISYSFDNFDNRALYSNVLLVILMAALVNGVLHVWQTRMLRQRGLL